MTAEATGVKKITVTFNQAVDTTTTKIVVKKGSATPTIAATTYATDAASAELAMGTKLTAGTYTVEATVGEKVLTADITVKDEAMTAFQLVSTNLVADPDVTSTASISFKAVNQYGEPMTASNVTATCSFGKADITTDAKVDKNGVVTVTEIPTTLCIDGQTGTLVLVNNENGVNLNETITYRSKAVASAATVLGIYDTKTDKVIEGNLKVGATASQYQILVNIQDQYGSDMDMNAVTRSKSDISLNPAKVLTDLDLDVPTGKNKTINSENGIGADKTYDGKTCIALPLTATDSKIAKAGTLSLTMVSATKGVIATPSFTVDDVVLIESFSVSATDTIYNGAKSKLAVEAIDVNGNAVTKYDELKAAFSWSTSYGTISLEKNSDGSGTFYYTPNVSFSTTDKQNTSLPTTVIFNANDPASGKYIVKPVSFTVYEAKLPVKVSGISNDAVTAVANTAGAVLTLDLSKVTVEDQYSNTTEYNKLSADAKAGVTAYLDDKDNIFTAESGTVTFTDGKNDLTASGNKGDATLYLKYVSSEKCGDANQADKDHYDIKVTLSAVDVSNVTSDQMTVKVNDGKAIYGANTITLTKATSVTPVKTKEEDQTASVVVTAKVAGKNVVIPVGMYTITSDATLGNYGKVGAVADGVKTAEKTETKTVTVVVDAESKPQELSVDVTVSNASAKATEIKDADAGTTINAASDGTINKDILCGAIKVLDQYGDTISTADKNVLCTVTFTGANADDIKISKNATQDITATLTFTDANNNSISKYTASVTYVYAGITYTTNVTIE